MASVFAYVRFSSDRQSDGDSTERQTNLAKAEEAKRGLVIDEWIHDEGRSAFTGANRKVGNLSRWLARLDSGEIKPGATLLVEAIDRLSREAVMDALDTYTRIINAGVTIITTMDGQVHSRANLNAQWTGLVVTLSKMAVANDESEKKSVRAKSAWAARRADPEAKRMVSFLPGWLTDVRTPNPERVQLIARIFHEIADRRFGSGKVARRLNEEGVASWGPTKRDGRRPTWHNAAILKLVRGRSVLGEFQPMKMEGGERVPVGPVVSDYYPRVIEPALYHRAQAALDGKSFKGSRGAKGKDYANLFSKLARCEHCGAASHRHSTGPRHVYLSCSAGARGVCDNRKGVPYAAFEAKFLDVVLSTRFEGGRADDSAAIARLAEAEHEREVLGRRLEGIAEQLLDLKSKTLLSMLEKAEARAVELDEEIIAARSALTAIQATPAPHASQDALAAELAKLALPDSDRYAIRSSLAGTIATITESLTFDRTGMARIVLADGRCSYAFDVRDGKTFREEVIYRDGSVTTIDGGVVTTEAELSAFRNRRAA